MEVYRTPKNALRPPSQLKQLNGQLDQVQCSACYLLSLQDVCDVQQLTEMSIIGCTDLFAPRALHMLQDQAACRTQALSSAEDFDL